MEDAVDALQALLVLRGDAVERPVVELHAAALQPTGTRNTAVGLGQVVSTSKHRAGAARYPGSTLRLVPSPLTNFTENWTNKNFEFGPIFDNFTNVQKSSHCDQFG